jgi:tetratricopeptide (TPR) repeat protein
MRKLKKLTTFLLSLAAVTALMVFNTGCTAKAKKIYHENRADKFYAAGQLEQAEIEYLNVLHNAPGDGHAIGRLGLIYFQQGRMELAGPYLLKGSEMATNDVDLRLKSGFIYVAMGRLDDARAAANFVIDRKPQDPEAPLLLAQAVGTQKQMAATQARLQKLAAAGDHPAIEVALGTLAFREHDLKSADASFKRALALDPKFSPAFAGLATLSIAENDLTNAEINFQAAAADAPDRSPTTLLYARFKADTGDVAGGRQVLEDMVKRTPDYLPAWIVLAKMSFSQKKYDESHGFLEQVLTRDGNNFDGLMLDSQLKLAQTNLPAATAQLERMAQLYPQSPNVYYQLGQAYLMGNDSDKAVTCLERALSLNPDYAEAILLLAQIQIHNQKPDPAIFALEKLVHQRPQLVQAQVLLANAYSLNNRFDDALAIYSSLEKSFPKNPQIPLLAGSTYAQQNNIAAARREFNRALEIAPDNMQVLEQLVNLDLAEKHFDSALQMVQSRLQTKPDEVALYVIESRIFSAENKHDQAEAALLQAGKVDPNNMTVYLLLAQSYINSKQNDQALAQIKEVLAKDPKNLSALMLQASVYGSNKDYQKQADTYEQMLEIDPQYTMALNNLAWIYSQNIPRLDRAYDLAQRAHALMPDDPSTADTLGWISFQRGAYPSALQLIQQSSAKLPNDPEIQFHLGMANYMSGNEDAARTAFQRALQISSGPEFSDRDECKNCLAILDINPQSADAAALALLQKRIAEKPGDPVALGRLAAAYQYRGNADQAIASYEAVLQAAPNNLTALLNLAQLDETKDAAKAYDLAKSAYKLAPDSPVAVRIYGHLAYQNGDFKLANALLQQAVQNQTDDPQTFFDFGQAAYSLGKISDAQTAMQNALQLNLPAPQSTEARRLLDLIGLAADPVQAVAATARISGILKSEPGYVPALMVAGVIDERNANGSSAEVAYEKVLAQYPDFSPAQRQLAILYSKDPAKLRQAHDLATKARAVYPDDAALTKATGIVLFLQGDYSHAANLLKDAAASLPTDPELFYYLGTAQFKLNENRAAKASLQGALNLKLSGQLADSAKQMLGQLK